MIGKGSEPLERVKAWREIMSNICSFSMEIHRLKLSYVVFLLPQKFLLARVFMIYSPYCFTSLFLVFELKKSFQFSKIVLVNCHQNI